MTGHDDAPAPADPFLPYADELLRRADAAMGAMRPFDQATVDRVVEVAARAAFDARLELARMACEETSMGILADKVQKNAWASLVVHEDLVGRTSVGELRRDPARGLVEWAEPAGPIVALTPVTNPTSTVITKILFCLKTRNAVIFSPHRGARRSSREAGRIMMEAAVAAGAPPDAVQWITKPQPEALDRVMRHGRTGLILATGTGSIVRTAQNTGKPTIGVGPGNVPVYVHASASPERAAACVVHSKTFDHGTVCASEQAVVADRATATALRAAFIARGAHFCSDAEARALGPICFDPERRTMRAEIVGQPAARIAELAGFAVPPSTRLLVAPLSAEPLGDQPLAYEILAPVLAWLEVDSLDRAYDACAELLSLGGEGHTLGLHSTDAQVIERFSRLPAGRVLVDTPTTGGAVGGIWNALTPSLTLTCGTRAGNDRLDNIGIEHLIEVRRVAERRDNRRWLRVGARAWMDPSLGAAQAFEEYRR